MSIIHKIELTIVEQNGKQSGKPLIVISRYSKFEENRIAYQNEPNSNERIFDSPIEKSKRNYKQILYLIDTFTEFPCVVSLLNYFCFRSYIKAIHFQSFHHHEPSAFTSKEFDEYCQEENIKHVTVTTGLLRANG